MYFRAGCFNESTYRNGESSGNDQTTFQLQGATPGRPLNQLPAVRPEMARSGNDLFPRHSDNGLIMRTNFHLIGAAATANRRSAMGIVSRGLLA